MVHVCLKVIASRMYYGRQLSCPFVVLVCVKPSCTAVLFILKSIAETWWLLRNALHPHLIPSLHFSGFQFAQFDHPLEIGPISPLPQHMALIHHDGVPRKLGRSLHIEESWRHSTRRGLAYLWGRLKTVTEKSPQVSFPSETTFCPFWKQASMGTVFPCTFSICEVIPVVKRNAYDWKRTTARHSSELHYPPVWKY